MHTNLIGTIMPASNTSNVVVSLFNQAKLEVTESYL